MRNPAVTFFLLFSMIGATVWSEEPVPVGLEFQVNTYTTENQGRPAVAFNIEGAFVVVWESIRQDGSDWSIQ